MKKFFCCILSISMIFVFATGFAPISESNTETPSLYSITEPYVYPMEQDSEEWRSLKTSTERIEAFSVPDDIISNMTTEALYETVISNPYFFNIVAFDSIDLGIEIVSTYVDGLPELLERDDFMNVAEGYSAQLASVTLSESTELTTEILALNLMEQVIDSQSNSSNIASRSSDQVVQTPNGNDVAVIQGLTYLEHGYSSETAAKAYQTRLLANHPTAVIVRDISSQTDSYNCHSYAWYRQLAQNPMWMDDPTKYMEDGSYSQTTARVNARVYWQKPNGTSIGDPVHSGIIYSTPSGSTPSIITSKWDCYGLIRHQITDCPYNAGSVYTSVWYR